MGQGAAPQATPALGALLVLLLGGCSGTPWGDQLARSFSAPQQAPTTPTPTPRSQAKPAEAPNKPKAAAPTAPALPEAQPTQRVTVMPPAPYRITIQLPAADPSAPAEAVTEALRKAGVPFEVEMIERVSSNGAPGSTATPAPAPAARPAPAPRLR